MEHYGKPPPGKLVDDGLETWRAKQQEELGDERYHGGFAGKSSQFRSSTCNIDRRDWTTLDAKTFNKEYYDKGKPVVLFGDGLVKLKDGEGTCMLSALLSYAYT
jgi:hypothetical protein